MWKQPRTWLFGAGLIGAQALTGARLGAQEGMEEIPIQVSPHVINLSSGATWVTVHADIRYSLVDGNSVTLNGVDARYTKSDLRGDLVAKFTSGSMRDVLAPGAVVLVLEGRRLDGVTFTGRETIDVIDGGRK